MKNLILTAGVLFCTIPVWAQSHTKNAFIEIERNNNQFVYCCGNTGTLIDSTNLMEFISDYDYNILPFPGEWAFQDVLSINDMSYNIEDHSVCEGGTGDDLIAIVNGRTQQPQGTYSTIYKATVSGLSTDSTYTVCGFLKNLPQGLYDVLPSVRYTFTDATGYSSWQTVSTDPNDPCDWQRYSVDFRPTNSTVTMEFQIREDGIGDGNDLAIDDFSLNYAQNYNVQTTIESQTVNSDHSIVTGSINSLSISDDVLPDSACKYIWLVAESTNVSATLYYPDLSNIMVGDNDPSNNSTADWGLTTTFPGYNGGVTNGIFENSKLYMVLLYVYNCDCSPNDFTFQYVYNLGKQDEDIKIMKPEFSEKTKKDLESEIKQILKNGNSQTLDKKNVENTSLKVYPNPSKNVFNVDLKAYEGESEIRILDSSGRIVEMFQTEEPSLEIDWSRHPNGVYMLQVTQGGNTSIQRLLKTD